ncbi:LytTR family DNA-binding domain-containing protein [Liquorilactobacillus oeni]|uniref:HTH LytTR-type domain-containing protein n=1 Tax=Liquorilactobacillus oeni DSM 19972 TaxID=1423777 RepID=A0A0R1MKY5_9LACO|nr:LytTR family DNA-binding domain-containing protein [Liquorilactobacillus oeni]KRL06002.1 hypothetical protein FD46_GL000334 [Liquorilactobacillus oeni DSM 19972]
MKIKATIDSSLEETEIIIHAPANEQIHKICQLLQEKNKMISTLKVYKGITEYYMEVPRILFFETEGRQVNAHTAEHIYITRYRLYELERLLPQNFMRISKSTILNTEKIFSLTHSLSNSLVQLQDSYKQVYVSRKYYKELRKKLEERK